MTKYKHLLMYVFHAYNTASYSQEGIWNVTFDPQPPSGPFTIRITSDYQGIVEVIDLQDVLFGDVWVCSGQSNMAFDVKDVSYWIGH